MSFVYEWINNLNQKWYVGSHNGTLDDGYVGSGTAFKAAIEKYGIENFTRIILYEGNNYKEEEIKILNARDAAHDPQSYNLKNNAKGGFGTLKNKSFEEIYGIEGAQKQKDSRRATVKSKIANLPPSKAAIDRAEASRKRLKKNFKDTKNELLIRKKEHFAWNKGIKLGPTFANKAWETKRKKLKEDPTYILHTNKGKTLEDLHGKEKAQEIKAKQLVHKKGKTSKRKGKSLVELYGVDRAKEIKDAQSLARQGKILVNGKLIKPNEIGK